jgi:UDP-2,3-diacylglucosamine pyrophosphatase LpxH
LIFVADVHVLRESETNTFFIDVYISQKKIENIYEKMSKMVLTT